MFYISDGMSIARVNDAVIWISVIITLAVPVAFYLLRSFGLYTLGKRNGVRNAYIAFIPFIWYYVLFKLIRESNIFGFSFGKFATIFTVICSASAIIPFIVNAFDVIAYAGYYLQGGELTYLLLDGTINAGSNFVNPFDVGWLKLTISILSYVSSALEIITLVLEVFAYINLFRKFWPEHYILGAVLSAMQLFPIMVFIIRKKKAVNFIEYMRSRYYYGNQYGPNNYSSPQNRQQKPENPFGEFSEKEKTPDDPFEEFKDKR